MEAVRPDPGRTQDITTARKQIMDMLAKATMTELEDAFATIAPAPAIAPVRGPETGMIMVRGRIGAGGAPFNLGEATVSRATIRLSTGEIGHGQTLGGNRMKARLIAVFDALAQRPEHAPLVGSLVASVAQRVATEDRLLGEETAATRVDFFTMVRGDN
jgi:alpha-D-ribose 1-methylphosphonate 5-triphosphate synthase subunit PhnG